MATSAAKTTAAILLLGELIDFSNRR